MHEEPKLPKGWRVTYNVVGGKTMEVTWPFPERPGDRQIAALIRSELGPAGYTFPEAGSSQSDSEAVKKFLSLNLFENLRSTPIW